MCTLHLKTGSNRAIKHVPTLHRCTCITINKGNSIAKLSRSQIDFPCSIGHLGDANLTYFANSGNSHVAVSLDCMSKILAS